MTRIRDIRVIRTRPAGTWVIVKVMTDQDGLYGIGSAHDYNNTEAVVRALEDWVKPRLIGRDAGEIEEIWHDIYMAGYWRNGPVLNTALAGVDIALWDIKAKEAGMPLYRLLGGPCRRAVPAYAHAVGGDFESLEEDVRRYMEEGYTVIRCQLGPYGGGGFLDPDRARLPRGYRPSDGAFIFDEEKYVETVPRMFEHLRARLGFEVKLCHDVHEHLTPNRAVQLAKLLEPYRLFFLEDLLPPEHLEYYRQVRAVCTTPQAVGELFTNPNEWVPLISERLIDFIRVRVSKVGGITRALKIAHMAYWFGVRTAWQEGGNTDPVNLTASLHLDMAVWNFGIQEDNRFTEEELEAFPGHPVLEGGYYYLSDRPGLGIDVDEEKARRLLDAEAVRRPRYVRIDRRPDGTAVMP